MGTTRLTDLIIRNTRPPDHGQIVIWDSVIQNFGVRLSQGGTRSYVVMIHDGRRRKRITFGRFPALGLADARNEAKRILAGAMLGTLPDKGEKAVLDFAEALDLFGKTHCAKRNRANTAAETTRLLRRHFLPKLGDRTLPDIRNQDVVGIIDRMLDTPSEANHAFSAIRKFFNWAR
ncbi:MAG TPA: Arm DNA-binding domain-containing protein, partial [Kaistiaceae bacterium]|nr:Arm DNA-binding domain-containing protein [Kaistiaceae bacterium]